jgi:hypothetical protein
MIIIEAIFGVYEFIVMSFGWFFAIWVTIGSVILPFWYVYYLYKNRKNKKEFLNALFSGVALIFFVTVYFFINKV